MDTNSSLEETFSVALDWQWCNNKQRGKCVNNIDNAICSVKQTIVSQFPNLTLRIGLSKTHVIKSKFHQKITAKHPNGRREPPS